MLPESPENLLSCWLGDGPMGIAQERRTFHFETKVEMCVSGCMVMDHEAQGAMVVRVAHRTAKRLGGTVRFCR